MGSRKEGLFQRLFGGSPPTLDGSTDLYNQRNHFAAGGTHTGLVRENNQDAFLCDQDRGLFLVCDGMGGMAAGEVASQEAVRSLSQSLTEEVIQEAVEIGRETVDNLLDKALEEAGHSILERVKIHPEWKNMGTTAVVAILGQGVLHLANLGDSRAYLVRKGEAQLLTRDHSVAAALVALGELKISEVRDHPLRNRLTACLGLPEFRQPAHATIALEEGDRILLCSDGLWDLIEDKEIAQILASTQYATSAVQSLIEAAKRAGGHDNITAIVLLVTANEARPDYRLEVKTTHEERRRENA